MSVSDFQLARAEQPLSPSLRGTSERPSRGGPGVLADHPLEPGPSSRLRRLLGLSAWGRR